MANGIIIYRGPSLLDGAPIVVIATGFKVKSENTKTGAMIQTYILRSDMPPTVAVKTGADASICGNCALRGNGDGSGRRCYVTVGKGPQAVYRAFARGKYPSVWSQHNFNGRKVRLGAYGDPAAVPIEIWKTVTYAATGWTGYTHQWRTTPALQPYVMASADSPEDALQAQMRGWRTFRVVLPGAVERLENEGRCPASAEAGKKLTCSICMACSGGKRRGSIVIQAHGGFAVMANINRKAA